MNQPPHTATTPSTNRQTGLPRRPRLASAIASALVTGALFAGVVLGMTSTPDAGGQLVAHAQATARA